MNEYELSHRDQPVAVGPLRMSKLVLAISGALLMVIVWAIGSTFPRATETSSLIEKLLSNQLITFAGAFLIGCWVIHILKRNPSAGINPDAKMWVVAFLAGHFGSQVFPLLF